MFLRDVILTLALALGAVSAAHATEFGKTGIWTIAIDDEAGICLASSLQNNRYLLFSVFDVDGVSSLRLSLADSRWKLVPNQIYPVQVTILPQHVQISSMAEVVSPRQVNIDLPVSRVGTTFVRGSTLSTKTPGNTFDFMLDGVSAAMNILASCIQQNASHIAKPFGD